ncbi:MAG: O-antigen ligase family protein [Demequinaceae bacterium]|nr:O-antigen ligase family protein [Demequinaceae bacterium]
MRISVARITGKNVAGGLLLIAVGAALGVLSAGFVDFAMPVAIAVLIIGLAARDLSLMVALAAPATLIVARVGGALSVSDVVLVAATMFSLLMLRGRGAIDLQPLIWAGVGYLALAIPALVFNPYPANGLEWMHEVFLVLGSMVVGFVTGRQGKAGLSIGVYIVACSVIGLAAAIVAVVYFGQTGAFRPVYLGDLHKNTIGGMLAVAAVIAYARPSWLGWSTRSTYVAFAFCGVGILASLSRQGLIGALAGVLIITLRPLVRGHRRGKLIWLATVPVVAFILREVHRQITSGDKFNSVYQRLTWFEQSVDVWRESPVFGVGLRWWYTDRFAERFQPPNAELEVLTTVGIVGLIGFLLMFASAAWLLAKMDPVYGTVGLAVLATRFTQAQFDLYWVAGQASLLWIVAGICYGVRARDRAQQVDPQPSVIAPVARPKAG